MDPYCCAWVQDNSLFDQGVLADGAENKYCGKVLTSPDSEVSREDCCGTIPNNCDDVEQPKGVAYDAVSSFAINESLFYQNFIEAWSIATTNGFNDLIPINPSFVLKTSGKLILSKSISPSDEGLTQSIHTIASMATLSVCLSASMWLF